MKRGQEPWQRERQRQPRHLPCQPIMKGKPGRLPTNIKFLSKREKAGGRIALPGLRLRRRRGSC